MILRSLLVVATPYPISLPSDSAVSCSALRHQYLALARVHVLQCVTACWMTLVLTIHIMRQCECERHEEDEQPPHTTISHVECEWSVSCHTYEWAVSHIWMSHVTHMNESCHTYEWHVECEWNVPCTCDRTVTRHTSYSRWVSYSQRRWRSSISDVSFFSMKYVALQYEMCRSFVWNVSLFSMKCVTLRYEICRSSVWDVSSHTHSGADALQYQMWRSSVWNLSLFSTKHVTLQYEMCRSFIWNVSLFSLKCVTL